MNRPAIIFAAETLNLAEVTRMVEIAKVAQRTFEPIFLSYDGMKRNHHAIEGHRFRVVSLSPQLDETAVERFWRADRMESFTSDFFSEADLQERVASELKLYEAYHPVAVVTGFCLSVNISARVAGIPLVWVAQSTWLLEYSQTYAQWPEFADWAVLRWIPVALKDAVARQLVGLGYALWSQGLNKLLKTYGLSPLKGSGLFEGDHTLFAEPEGFSEIAIPQRLVGRSQFIGPLLGSLDIPVPQTILDLPQDLPLVYFAMGSSGSEDVVRHTLCAFANQPFRVIAPVKALLKNNMPNLPPNVTVTDWLPAEKVNKMASVSVLHGGIGTLFTACLAGTPIIGIPNGNPEQEWNLSCLVRKGFAKQLHKYRFTPQQIVSSILAYLQDSAAQQQARLFQAICEKWNGPLNATLYLEKVLGYHTPDKTMGHG